MPVKTNIGEGANIRKDTATEAFVLNGLTFHAGKSQKQRTGTMPDKSGTTQSATASLDTANNRVQISIPVTGYYDTGAKLYAAFTAVVTLLGLTAAKIANGTTVLGVTGTYKGIGTATAAQVLTGYTFSSESLSGADGTMPNLTSNATITHTSSNATKVIVGDAAFATTNSDSVNRVEIRYNGNAGYITANTLFAIAYSTMATAISLTAAKIATGITVLGITGTYNGLGDAYASDVLAGKTFSTASLSNETGTMVDKTGTTQSATASLDSTNSRVQMKIPATGKYNTSSYLYATYSTIASLIGLTAAKIATGTSILGITGSYKGVGTAAAAQVLTGYTFSSASLSGASGSMADKSGTTQEATASLDTTNSRLQMTIPATGYYNTSAKLYAAYSTIRTLIGLTATKLGYGKTCLGLTGTYKPTVKRIAANAVFGFGNTSTSYLSDSATYTCPAAGTCYYDGFAVTYNKLGTVTCEIYKNGTLVEDANISGDYVQRGTMLGKSVSVAKDDVIKIVAEVTSASVATYSRMSLVTATIVTYE